MAAQIEELTLVEGRIYACKNPKPAGMFKLFLNDRKILAIGKTQLVWKGPATHLASTGKTCSIEEFQNWAFKDITEEVDTSIQALSGWRYSKLI